METDNSKPIEEFFQLLKQFKDADNETKLNNKVMNAIDKGYPQYNELKNKNKELRQIRVSVGHKMDDIYDEFPDTIDLILKARERINKPTAILGGRRKTKSLKRRRKTNKKISRKYS